MISPSLPNNGGVPAEYCNIISVYGQNTVSYNMLKSMTSFNEKRICCKYYIQIEISPLNNLDSNLLLFGIPLISTNKTKDFSIKGNIIVNNLNPYNEIISVSNADFILSANLLIYEV